MPVATTQRSTKRKRPRPKLMTVTIQFKLPETEVQDAQAEALWRLVERDYRTKKTVTVS